MTATTSHINETTETKMHRTINFMIVFALGYGSMIYWWTNSFHFNFLLQAISPETTQYFADRTRDLNEARKMYWWQPILDVIGPIITTAGVTYAAILMKGLAEEQLRKLKLKSKKNK